MLDRGLAMLYGVTTKRLNEQVKRNVKRFPSDFMFQLTKFEKDKVVANCDHLRNLKYSSQFPYVFTEQGVAMLSGVLHSEKAIEVNVAIMRVFVNLRKFISSYEGLAMKIAEMEQKYDKKITEVFKVLDILMKEDKNKKIKEIGLRC